MTDSLLTRREKTMQIEVLDWVSLVMLQCTKPYNVKIVDHVIQPDVPRDACSNTAKTAKKR